MNFSRVLSAVAALALIATPVMAAGIKAYPTEDEATKLCKSEVVWANPNSAGVFHVKGSKFYGNTKEGAWVCRAAAERGGWHEAKNGQ